MLFTFDLVAINVNYKQLNLFVKKKYSEIYLDNLAGYGNKYKWIKKYKYKIYQVNEFYFRLLKVQKANS